MNKIIKKILKLLSYLLVIITLLPAILYGIFQIPRVQDYIINELIVKISTTVGVDLKYSKARIVGVRRVQFENLFIGDSFNDTLIYSSNTEAVMPIIFDILWKKDPETIVLRKLLLEEANLKLKIDSSGKVNLSFLVDYIKANQDTLKEKKPVKIRNITIVNSCFKLENEKGGRETKGIDFSNMIFNEFNVEAKNLVIFGDTVKMHVRSLAFVDRSGFDLDYLECDLEICNKHMYFDDLSIKTEVSNIAADRVRLSFDSYKDFKANRIFEKVMFDMNFSESQLNTCDLGYFSRFFWKNDQLISFSGNFYGPMADIKGNDLIIGWGNSSLITGSFGMNGLPDIKRTFLVFNLKELVTNSKDIASLNIPGNKSITFPERLEKLKDIKYSGVFTGFFTDFVVNGRLSTNLGEIRTDLLIVPDSLNSISFSGRINTNNFSIGHMFGKEGMLGEISIDAQIAGNYTKDQPIQADIQGIISKISVNNYPYQDVTVQGKISNKKFNGLLNVNDPNLKLEFEGLLDMAAEPRRYVFQANVIEADLFALNISDADTNYNASFLMKANLEGNSLDELNGEFRLLNSLFSKAEKQIQVYDLEMIIQNNSEINEVILESDILDATISGKYKVSVIHHNLINYLSEFIPALIGKKDISEEQKDSAQLNLSVNFKRTGPFFDFFFPAYYISPGTNLKATYLSQDEGFLRLNIFAPEIRIKSNTWQGLVFNLESEDSLIHASIGSRVFNFNKRIDFENFTLESTTYNNTIGFSTRWLNWDSTLYKGALSGSVSITNGEYSQNKYKIDLNSSSITISDSVWYLSDCMIAIDSSGFEINNFKLTHDDQYFMANGKLSETPGDSLFFYFKEFNLANLNFFTKKRDFEFGGNINGKGNMSDIKNNPLFFSSLTIDDLEINEVDFGNCYIRSLWNNKKQSLSIDAMTRREELTTLRFTGDYYPNEMGKMDFRITLNNLRSSILNPFVTGIFSDISGQFSGDVLLTGVKGKPALSGKLSLQENSLTVDYLNTRYNFTTDVEISNNNFIFNDVALFDREGNRAILNGMIRTEYFKNLALNLRINTQNLLCLDTREINNDQFYGIAYTTGLIRINGEPASLRFDIEAETGKNTRFFIPLNGESEVSEFKYINFVPNDTSDNEYINPEPDYKVDLTGIQMNFNLNVTSDAEVQIIFDPKMGDIIKANGRGEMKMSINTLGSFELLGEYAIEKGDYLFTLQDVINRRLKIQEGSLLRWTGDPLNAQVDITAVYRTKASLSDLYGSNESESYQGRVTVDCRIYLTGLLMSPTIKYDLYLPYAEDETRNRVNSRINTEEDVSKQFLSLMVLNRFMLDQSLDNQGESSSGSDIAGVNANASELLSNQLSNWLSQISSDFDIGVNYRPGTEITDREVELALSTQLLNDRLSLNGSVDMKTNAQAENSNKIVGDFDVDYKINKKGKLRMRAFNRSNDNLLTDYSPYTQGVGIFYMEEFNSFGALVRQYWDRIRGKKKK